MKTFKRLLAIGAALTLSAGFAVGCSVETPPDLSADSSVTIEEGKSQLYVFSFAGGYGTEWLSDLARRYEEANADKSFESGKKGIQVIPTNSKSQVSSTVIKNGKEMVYFAEQVDYYGDLKGNNAVADITKAVTGKNPYDAEGVTLESKLYDDQKSYFNINGAYYAYPHYLTSFGFVYDVTLFNERGYFFAQDRVADTSNQQIWMTGQFINTTNRTVKSKGPDGQSGTSDDGLPATYEEFFTLCDYIAMKGDMPMLWTGQYYSGYMTHIINALASEYEGYQQMRMNFTFNGTATNLGKIVNGQFVEDTTDTPITSANAYELKRQAGKYYGLSFVDKLFKQNFVTDNHFSSTYSHLDAQEAFLKNVISGDANNKAVAMLAEGTWWESEAQPVFNELRKNANYQEREYAWMPLPKATASKVGEKSVMYDIMYPLCVVKGGVTDWRYDAAIDFVQFANSQESLEAFNNITGVPKAVKYEMKDTTKMSAFGKSLYTFTKNADIVFPYSNSPLFVSNQTNFSEINGGAWNSKVNPDKTPTVTFHEKKTSAADFFTGMYDYAKVQEIYK